MPHISITDFACLAPVGIWLCKYCCKSRWHSWSSALTSVSIFFLFWTLLAFATCGGSQTPPALIHCPYAKTKELSPWAATYLPQCISLFCFFFPSLLFASACIVQSQNVSAQWARTIHRLSKWNGGGGVTLCSSISPRSRNSTQNLNWSLQTRKHSPPSVSSWGWTGPRVQQLGRSPWGVGGLGIRALTPTCLLCGEGTYKLGALTHPPKYRTAVPIGKALPNQPLHIS